MSQNKDTIFKLRDLVKLRENTITANKRAMKGYLIDYKKSLELDRELKREIKTLKTAINLLQYEEKQKTQEVYTSENLASNKDETIYNCDEE